MNLWKVCFTFGHGEEESSLLGSSDQSSDLSEETEGEIYCFQSDPLYDSSDQEDASICDDKISNHGCRDLFIDSFGHDYDCYTINLSKPLIFNYLSSDVLELPQIVAVLDLDSMVMSSSLNLEVSFNHDQDSPKFPRILISRSERLKIDPSTIFIPSIFFA